MSLFPALLYIALSLLSPDVLPEFLRDIHVIEILGVLNILIALVSLGRSGLLRLPDTYLITGILLAGAISIAATGWLGGAYTTFIGFVPIVFTYYFVVTACDKPKHLIWLTYTLFAVLCYILLQGMVAQMTGNFDSPYLIREGVGGGVDLYRHRGLGVVSDPNDLAQVLAITLPLLWLRWKKGAFAGNLLLTLVPAAILVVGIYQTHSRGGIFALIAVMLYAFKDRLGLVKGAIVAGVLTLGVFALNFSGGRGMDTDDGERISLWGQAMTAFRTHPLLGIGMFHFPDYSDLGLTAHNSYVLCLAEMGLIGYFVWMGAIVCSWYGLSRLLSLRKGAAAKTEEADAEPEGLATAVSAGGAERRREEAYSFAAQPQPGSLLFATAQSAPAAAELVFPASFGAPLGTPEEEEDNDATLIYFARIVHASFVGLLVSAFFLSRTYAMVFYIVFGISAAVQMMYRRRHPELTTRFIPLLQRIVIVMAVSIVGLYLFIRLHGVQ